MDPSYQYGKPKSPASVWKVVAGAAAALAFVYLLAHTASQTVRKTAPPVNQKAVVVLNGPGKVTGTVLFEQEQANGKVKVSGKIRGLDPNALRGFHIHKSGDLTNGCISAGPHFNPFAHTHGGPSDTNRHVGDLGNIKTDDAGDADFVLYDKQISLNGLTSIVGRAVVVHGGVDDLGKGNNPESLLTGNAGARVACGVIGLM
ncbi:superoxide dismutase [Panaeolus papilionaceus]|nr:superoxide dismutase [Panaeolus papilionaceus]